MKAIPYLIAILAYSIVAAPLAFAADRWHAMKKRRAFSIYSVNEDAALYAFRQAESGDDPFAVGPKKERTAYQFMSYTWARHSTVRFIDAADHPEEADRVARKHLWEIIKRLQATRGPHRFEQIAAAWRGGKPGDDHSRRVANLYFDYLP